MPFSNLYLGLVLSGIVSTVAYIRGALSASGVFGAILLGTIVFSTGGLPWAMMLIAFFVSSSILSHYKARVKEPLAEKFQKGHRRDMGQVLANGGAAVLAACAYAISPQPIYFVAFLGALATVTADTWATELGVLSLRPPRVITTGRVAAIGTSGAITLYGTFVALCGALFISIIAATVEFELPFINTIIVASVAGVFGSLFDSLLGATVQAIYFCDHEHTETESPLHRCGRATRHIRGWKWFDNDWVNFTASLAGGGMAALLYRVIG